MKKRVIENIMRQRGVDEKEAKAALEATLTAIKEETFADPDSNLVLRGFGTFRLVAVKAKEGVITLPDGSTKAWATPAKNTVKFKASKALIKSVN